MTEEDQTALKYAKALLEHPSMSAQLIALIGKPIEEGFKKLPEKVTDAVGKHTECTVYMYTVTRQHFSAGTHASLRQPVTLPLTHPPRIIVIECVDRSRPPPLAPGVTGRST